MLWVIAELDDVEAAVVCLQQVGLRTAAHFSDETAGVYGHCLEAVEYLK